ncbi:two component transcriptional regulator, LuxR family [Imhoffiella purpurea]|uniref:Two component transcriptional regulator, LuxR family n=2 Tax=Imhoffiella purpurea TaxID=1249627 RepID=W9VER3_9GAMM|nr:two component transcriptional regulator, LuxR family [Imhoffiella purpurea]
MRVVLADDHAIVRQGLASLLRAEPDIELVGEVGDGEDAWQAIGDSKPDIAVLDLAMPGATGIEIARRVESAGLATRILLLTMYEDPATALDAERAGVAGYVLKASLFDELILGVRLVAAGGTFMSPAIAGKLRPLRCDRHPTVTLSPREREVVRLLSQGLHSKEIARILSISPGTVDTYRKRLMQKLDVHSVAEVVRWAAESGGTL